MAEVLELRTKGNGLPISWPRVHIAGPFSWFCCKSDPIKHFQQKNISCVAPPLHELGSPDVFRR
jgi:hypothetical protein